MERRVAAVGLAVLLVLVAAPVQADQRVHRDGDATPGPLDIARIVHKHRPGRPNILIHKVVMHNRWDLEDLRSTARDSRRVTITFDVDRDRGYNCISCITEREVVVRAEDGQLVATLYNHLGDPPRELADLPVWRPSSRAVAFAVTPRQLSRSAVDFYEWGVQTIYMRRGSRACPRSEACFDLAPRRNDLLRHRL